MVKLSILLNISSGVWEASDMFRKLYCACAAFNVVRLRSRLIIMVELRLLLNISIVV
jgi:hypothetical protein